MHTQLADFIRDTPQGRAAADILRSCVHCGFCNATCPTYQLLGDELDGPRGRIYLMKQMWEGAPVSTLTRDHLDRCLGCRNCETTCPSGVQYGLLIDISREFAEQRCPRTLPARALRKSLRAALTSAALFGSLVRLGHGLRAFLPAGLRARLPVKRPATLRPPIAAGHRTMLVLDGCVQSTLAPEINAISARVLSNLGVHLISAPGAGCCGAIDQHLGASTDARTAMRRNIDAWWPYIEAGAEAIVMTASGCGSLVKEYGYHLQNDAVYADKAARVSALTRDLCEVLMPEDLDRLGPIPSRRIAFQSPCSLCHGQKVNGLIEAILRAVGHELVPVAEANLCCGSAGTYSLLQPALAGRLRERKLENLHASGPELIATANIGCQQHLGATSKRPVVHWVSLLEA